MSIVARDATWKNKTNRHGVASNGAWCMVAWLHGVRGKASKRASVFTTADEQQQPLFALPLHPRFFLLLSLFFCLFSTEIAARQKKRKEFQPAVFFVRVCMRLYPQRKQFRFLPLPPFPLLRVSHGGRGYFFFLSFPFVLF